ncbi:hypothetical protein [Microbulbifer sp. TYP-18]|uniref:hypothetical protein n=1 Tax=Microbulbifer sp. TYP-18 TaxID=3230024 RepID=UPI0034C5E78C
MRLIVLLVFLSANVYASSTDYQATFQREEIEKLFASSFPFEVEIEETWVFDDRQDRLAMLRMEMISDQIDAGKEIEYLAKYGIERISEGKYSIDLSAYPGWMTVSQLFGPMTSPNFVQQGTEALRARGFSEKDLQVLTVYLEENQFIKERQKLYLNYLKVEGPGLVRKFNSPGGAIPAFRDYKNNLQKRLRKFEKEWFRNLYRSLDQRAGRVLISYLVELSSDLTIIRENNFNESVERLFASIKDGSLVRAIEKQSKGEK